MSDYQACVALVVLLMVFLVYLVERLLMTPRTTDNEDD